MNKIAIQILKSKIKPSNLLLLNEEDRNDQYELKRLYAWQEDYYDYVEWKDFKDWLYCERCKCYTVCYCSCYAR